MNDRYMKLVRGGLRAIGRIGKWTGIALLLTVGSIVTISLLSHWWDGVGPIDIGIGPVGWISISLILGLAVYGSMCLLRRK